MRGVKAKRCRKVARATCDASITEMSGRGFKIPEVLGKDINGDVVLQDGKPIVLTAAYIRYTMFWPRNSYRRSLRETKTGKPCAWINERS